MQLLWGGRPARPKNTTQDAGQLINSARIGIVKSNQQSILNYPVSFSAPPSTVNSPQSTIIPVPPELISLVILPITNSQFPIPNYLPLDRCQILANCEKFKEERILSVLRKTQ